MLVREKAKASAIFHRLAVRHISVCYDSGIVLPFVFFFGSFDASVGGYVFLFRRRFFDLVGYNTAAVITTAATVLGNQFSE